MLWQNSINSVIFSAINVLESEGLNLKTGFKELDEIITLDSNKLILVYGKPAVGKTTFAVKLLNNVVSQNVPSLFFSLELSKESITNENAKALFIDDTANVTIYYNTFINKKSRKYGKILYKFSNKLQFWSMKLYYFKYKKGIETNLVRQKSI